MTENQCKKKKSAIYWFRKCLRLHDNPSLSIAIKECEYVYPIYILDPWFKNKAKVGANRWRFLWESLKDLDNSLIQLNSGLLVFESSPKEILEMKIGEWNITDIYYEGDTEPYAVKRDSEINEIMENYNISVHVEYSHTLYNPHILYKLAGGRVTETYSAFLTLIKKAGLPHEPYPPVETPFKRLEIKFEDFCLPEMEKFYSDLINLEPIYKGGHNEALNKMNEKLKNAQWICEFSKPNTNPCALIPSTTVLSPYLKFGCLSVRLFYKKIKETYKSNQHTKPPESLEAQLLWREFFYFVGAFTENFDKMKGNPLCKQINWDNNESYLKAWENAQTGYPYIDAIMTQLRKEGWIHHLARHVVACFLTRGDLYCSWEHGKMIFEELLLDADWSLNAANWQWLSASRFFNQYWRVYSPVSFGKKYDVEGEYVRKYLPILKNYPSKYIYEPWKAPLEIQKKYGAIIGKDYPFPIVDHSEVSKINMNRMKKAFSDNKEGP